MRIVNKKRKINENRIIRIISTIKIPASIIANTRRNGVKYNAYYETTILEYISQTATISCAKKVLLETKTV